ncbi:MAG: ABC transporter ATP-binding protein [Proteobacteria bacterium]|jgi:phospholipid/cholesterol/gamma-HCH transport system ATP-binding protein|nr:ABC transporter ATP-binding protein [Pseudomonadota bacterium]
MNPSEGNLIEVRGLRQTFGGQEILRGVDLDIPRGKTLVLLGQSGGGKSVFLRHLIGLLKPIAGSIRVEGEEIAGLDERELEPVRRKIGMLFQDGALFDSMTVFENVSFPLRERGLRDEKEICRKVREALELVALSGQESKMPANLSGGMRKRAALARVIISEPSCILYDEPTAGLDPIVSDTINRLIRRLQSHLHVTSIVVTHDMISTNHIADRVALLRSGRIHFEGSLGELHGSPDPVIRDFIEGRSHEID